MSHYGVMVVPDARVVPLNRLIAMIEGEDILESQNLSRPCNPGGNPNNDVTHWLGGRSFTDEKLVEYQGLSANLPEPAGGWPLVVGGTEALTEADAQAAASAMVLTVTTADDTISHLAQVTLAAVQSALGIAIIQEPEEC